MSEIFLYDICVILFKSSFKFAPKYPVSIGLDNG